MKKDLKNIAKIKKALAGMHATGQFYLLVSTDVDLLATELRKVYPVHIYNVQITETLSINIYNE